MQTKPIEGQTDKPPLVSSSLETTQRAWAKTQDVFDNAQHRFDCTFSQAGDCAANLGLELVSHGDLRTGIRWRECGLVRKIRRPTGMMGGPPWGAVRLNVTRCHSRDVCGTDGPIVQGASLGLPQGPRP